MLRAGVRAAEVAGEGAAPPRAGGGVADGGEGAGADPALPAVAEGDGEGAVAAHAVAGDGAEARGDAEGALDEGGQLAGDVGVHLVVARVGLGGGVDVEARAGAEVPRRVLAFDAGAAGRRVGDDEGDALARGVREGAGLLGEVLVGAGEAREPVDGGDLRGVLDAGRDEDGGGHGRLGRRALVLEADQSAAGDGDPRQDGEVGRRF